jgi:hypothetical protein
MTVARSATSRNEIKAGARRDAVGFAKSRSSMERGDIGAGCNYELTQVSTDCTEPRHNDSLPPISIRTSRGSFEAIVYV